MTYVGKMVASLAVTVILTAWASSGGGATPSVLSSSEGTAVKGTVTITGKPANGGQVQFSPANMNPKDAAPHQSPIGDGGELSGKSLADEHSA